MKRPARMAQQLLGSALKKPVTISYPAEEVKMPEGFRGKIKFFPLRCIGCKLCMRDCPSEAIEIIKVGEKQFKAQFNLGRCIYCAQCVDSCNKNALAITDDFELAQLDPQKLKIEYNDRSEEGPQE